MPRVTEFLGQHRPDVLLLQETKTEDAAFPAEELREHGYHAVHHSRGRWAGVAILSTEPLSDPSVGLPGEAAEDEARWIEATTHGRRVASVYVPNGRAVDSPTFAEKLQFLDAMRDRVGDMDLVGGDFNVTRDDRDVYDPAAFEGETHVTPDERTRFEALLERGLADAYRFLHPDDIGYTWWDYRAGHFHKKMGLRIDYILVRDEYTGALISCGIDRNYRKGKPTPSDHAPLLCDLNL
jgi:exodeoxyribonuclease-3